MAKYFLFLFILLLLSYSCKKVEYNMNHPTVTILEPTNNTDIHLDSTYTYKAHFRDDKVDGLSSYFIRIWNPEIGEGYDRVIRDPNKTETDSLIYADQVYRGRSIFGLQDTTIINRFVIDSTASFRNSIHPVVRGKYQFLVVVINVDGNKDSSTVDINVLDPIARE